MSKGSVRPRIIDVTRPKLHAKQLRYYNSRARFNVVPAGRRTGKTDIAKVKVKKRALAKQHFPNPWHVIAAPTRDQVKRIYWRDMKDMIAKEPWLLRGPPRETELLLPLFNGADLQLMGLDVPARIEGRALDSLLIDEADNIKREAWEENIRPALSDRLAGVDFVGVPEGRALLNDLTDVAHADTTGEWMAHSWWSEEVLPLYLGREIAEREIASARSQMDERTFRQEYRAEFMDFAGRIYYTFSREANSHPVEYMEGLPLVFCFDFNVAPGVAVVCQERAMRITLPNLSREPLTCAIGEVHIPRNSNTELVCNRLIRDWAFHRGDVFVYGDATGGSSGSAKIRGSDWDIVQQKLKPIFGARLKMRVGRSNPPEKVRVNAMNSRIMSADGVVRFIVNPKEAPKLVRDLEGVTAIEGGSGEIDKKKDSSLTHLSDALGYYIHAKFPIKLGQARPTVESI